MSLIIDKRFLPKNVTTGSRQKFIERYKTAIKRRVREIVGEGSLKDFSKGNKKVTIKRDDLEEPSFQFEPGTGNTDRVYVGNKKFHKGQKVSRPSSSQGKGGGGSNGNGAGEDDFEFILTEKEFSDLFFEDLALPDLVKKEFIGRCFEIKHAGFSRYGGPSSLNIKKTMLNALGRRIALTRKRERAKELPDLDKGVIIPKPDKKIQYIEDIDLKYNFKDKVDVPTTRAVMFALMDVSGSMGEKEKDLAKRFFILLNLFLKRNYEIVDIVFIRHTETAQEVDENTFFHLRENGGTVISSGYEKINEIITARYNPENWNIYMAQASDGGNFDSDNQYMAEFLSRTLLPKLQYAAYIDIANTYMAQWRSEGAIDESEVYQILDRISKSNPTLQARRVIDYADIFPVFRSLFKKKEGK